MQLRQAHGLRNPCLWPARLGQPCSSEDIARHRVASTSLSIRAGAVQVVDDRCGQQVQQPLRSALAAAGQDRRIEGRWHRPPRAASRRRRRQADFEAAPKLRGGSFLPLFCIRATCLSQSSVIKDTLKGLVTHGGLAPMSGGAVARPGGRVLSLVLSNTRTVHASSPV